MVAALLGLVCVVAAGVILVALHFLPTGLDPIRYAVSDYGWTSYLMTDREPDGLASLTRTGRIHMLLAGTAFASIAVAASHLDWSGKPVSSARWGGS